MNYNAAALSNQSGFKSVKLPQKPLTNAVKGGIIKAEALSRYVNSSEALYEYAKK